VVWKLAYWVNSGTFAADQKVTFTDFYKESDIASDTFAID